MAPHLLPNSIEGKSAPYIQRVENILAEMDSRKGEYMAACKADREDINSIYTEAKEAGVPAKALKGVVKYRQLEKKQKAISAGLDIDEVSSYEILVEMLGDFATTDLGAAAVSRARKAKNGKPAEPDARGIANEIERQEIAAQKERDGEAFEDSAAA